MRPFRLDPGNAGWKAGTLRPPCEECSNNPGFRQTRPSSAYPLSSIVWPRSLIAFRHRLMFSWSYSIPLLVSGGVVALYWQQGLRMARKQRKRTGRAANLIPAEPLGRLLRVIWAPVILIWMAHPVAS